MAYGVKKFIKRPVVIEALQWTGHNATEIMLFVGQRLKSESVPSQIEREHYYIPNDAYSIEIPTREGIMTATKMDWIIKGFTKEVGLHYWVCKPDYFESAYERHEDQKTDWLSLYQISNDIKDREVSPAEQRYP